MGTVDLAMPISLQPQALLSLLQLASSALPVGAYSYSEGLEALVEVGIIKDKLSLEHWLQQELQMGAIRLEAAIMLRAYQATQAGDRPALRHWNAWLSATRETEELRQQSWQMGYSLGRLLQELQPDLAPVIQACGEPCNFAIAFGIAAASWQIDPEAAILGYLHSWATNLMNAGVKLIPLGQTAGQRLLVELQSCLSDATGAILVLKDEDLCSCGWGLAIASMAHEVQYSRLFRS
ncbi:urease accessory protein UreF [Trichocoleus sp. FACHB-591]|uniref:urease accessory protein UreF n=1 Tax=Trichocoleus sp. FACHB-591 TaxID=2692872 RepID=UPI001F55046A|nr:urease accessory protein UreF [Trichocoleus sp. FACHB-591]